MGLGGVFLTLSSCTTIRVTQCHATALHSDYTFTHGNYTQVHTDTCKKRNCERTIPSKYSVHCVSSGPSRNFCVFTFPSHAGLRSEIVLRKESLSEKGIPR